MALRFCGSDRSRMAETRSGSVQRTRGRRQAAAAPIYKPSYALLRTTRDRPREGSDRRGEEEVRFIKALFVYDKVLRRQQGQERGFLDRLNE